MAVRCQRQSRVVAVRCQRQGRGLAGLAGLELELVLELVWNWCWKEGWSGKKEEEKTGLDMSKTLRGDSAIALRYRRRLAGGASNPNVTKTMYHMRTLDEQATDSKN